MFLSFIKSQKYAHLEKMTIESFDDFVVLFHWIGMYDINNEISK